MSTTFAWWVPPKLSSAENRCLQLIIFKWIKLLQLLKSLKSSKKGRWKPEYGGGRKLKPCFKCKISYRSSYLAAHSVSATIRTTFPPRNQAKLIELIPVWSASVPSRAACLTVTCWISIMCTTRSSITRRPSEVIHKSSCCKNPLTRMIYPRGSISPPARWTVRLHSFSLTLPLKW